MTFQGLTIVCSFKEDSSGTSIHTDPVQLEELGLSKSLEAYAAIKEHCESVINAVIEEVGGEALLQVMQEMEAAKEEEALN